MRGECRASGDGSLYTVPSCELSDVKTKIMLNIGSVAPVRSAAVRRGAVRLRLSRVTSGRVSATDKHNAQRSSLLSAQSRLLSSLSLAFSFLSIDSGRGEIPRSPRPAPDASRSRVRPMTRPQCVCCVPAESRAVARRP